MKISREASAVERGSSAASTSASDMPGSHSTVRDAELGQHVVDEVVGAAVERSGVEEHIARADEGKKRRGNRRHAGGEDETSLGAVPQASVDSRESRDPDC